jgi:hypothetical protein
MDREKARTDDKMCLIAGGVTRVGRCDPFAAAVLMLAVLSVACEPHRVSGQQGGRPSAGEGPPPPGFTLPEGGAAQTPPPGPPAACAGEAHQAEIVPVDLMLLMDTSASMNSTSGARTMWDRAQVAIAGFIGDPASAGLGVGLQFFPAIVKKPCASDLDCTDKGGVCHAHQACPGPDPLTPGVRCRPGAASPPTCPGGAMCVPTGACSVSGALCTNIGEECPAGAGTCDAFPRSCIPGDGAAACDPASYETPAVAIGELPGTQGPLLRALNARYPDGGTPMSPAVQGALAHLRGHLAVNPTHKGVMVLVTDGTPSGCGEIPDVAAHLAVARLSTPSINTHVIGLFFNRAMVKPKLDQLASAGGSSQAIVLQPGTDLTAQLQEALTRIRGGLACEYRIPTLLSGRIDPAKVNLHYTGEGTSEDIPYVERPDRCDPMRGGWYYDVPPGMGVPTRILTCEDTCRRFRASETGKVDLVFGCATVIE